MLKRLKTQINESTNQNSPKSPKLLRQQIRKRYYKTFGRCRFPISKNLYERVRFIPRDLYIKRDLKDETKANKLMNIPKDDTQLVLETYGHST